MSGAAINPVFPERLLTDLSELVAGEIGLHFPRERWRDLERGIRLASRESGQPDAETYAQRLLSATLTRSQIEVLASALTVGETYFFREKRSFEIVREHILSKIIHAHRGGVARFLRIWSAGCCTGEEPYSIAILLDRTMPDLRDWQVTILGTDVNPRFLHKAREGVFGEWSFRGAPAWLKEHYFKAVSGGRFKLDSRIRTMVTFAHLNLAEDSYPSLLNNTNGMDIIFCRNVLMYFKPERARKVIQHFHHSLVDGGWLIVSPTEVSTELYSAFTRVDFEGAVLYRKESAPSNIQGEIDIQRESGSIWRTPPAFEVSLPAPAPSVQADESVAPSIEQAPKPAAQPSSYEEALELFREGDYAGAVQKLNVDSREHQTAPKQAALLARTYANLGDITKALAWAEKALAADKLNAGLHYLRAVILEEQCTIEEAAYSLKRALYLDPDFVLAHFALGNLALRKNKSSEAERHFSNALALLDRYEPDRVVPESDGLAAGRLRELIESTLSAEMSA